MLRTFLSPMRAGPVLLRALGGLFALAFGAKLVVLLWGSTRGFEMGDEGFFLMNLNHPEASPPFFEFYKLLGWLGSPRFGVVEARLIRIAIELVASLALAGGVFAWARARVFPEAGARFLPFLVLCLGGSLISTASRSVSYNDVTNLCTFVAVGCLFYLGAAIQDPGAERRRALAALAAGFLIGFQLAVKFPAALLLLALAPAALAVLFDGLPWRERWRLIALLGAGVLAAALLFIAANGGWSPLVDDFQRGMEGARLSGYGPGEILRRNLGVEFWTALNVAWLAAVYLGSRWLLRRRGAGPDGAAAGAWAVGGIALAATTYAVPFVFLHPSLVYLAALVWFSLLVLVVQTWREREAKAATSPVARLAPLLLLVALPFVAIAGTNVPLSMRLPTHVMPLFAAIAVLGIDLHLRTGRRLEYAVLGTLLLVSTAIVFVQHQVLQPYGLPRPLYGQQHPVTGLPGVRVDRATRAFLERVAGAMTQAGFRPDDPVVAFDYMPGLVHYLGGTSPGFPFYHRDRPQLNCLYLDAAGLTAPPFLVLGQALSDEQLACLRAFTFPDDFVLIDAPAYPYEDVYLGFGMPGVSRIYLYAPRR